MNTQQREYLNHPVSDQIAELLLEARAGRVPDGHPLLAGLLVAAAAPGRPVELSGEQACLLGFRAAQLATGAGTGRLSIVKTTMLRMLTVKAVLAACAAAGGGLALAGSTGVVDNPFHAVLPPGASDRSVTDSPAQHAPSRQPSGNPQPSRSAAEGDTGAPAPQAQSLLGLCSAYHAGNKAERGKALDSPAFSELIGAAGGRDKVDQFCDARLAVPLNAGPTADTAPPGRNHPTGKPTSHPGH
jgi:hypothetical protein